LPDVFLRPDRMSDVKKRLGTQGAYRSGKAARNAPSRRRAASRRRFFVKGAYPRRVPQDEVRGTRRPKAWTTAAKPRGPRRQRGARSVPQRQRGTDRPKARTHRNAPTKGVDHSGTAARTTPTPRRRPPIQFLLSRPPIRYNTPLNGRKSTQNRMVQHKKE